jgi:cyclopropane-fatty-acyl-phospholipid synthase
MLARLRTGWTGGRLDVIVPSGQCVRLGGAGPTQATVRIHDDRAFLRILLRGEMGGGEAFVAGEWSSDDLVAVLRTFLQGVPRSEATTSVQSKRRGMFGRPVRGESEHPARGGLESPLTRLALLPDLVRHRRAANTRTGSARNISRHYDLGNDFYRLFLDEDTLAYSCALFGSNPPADLSLADAQRAKLDRLCDWLELSPADHLLEIGCGWGGMAIHAARTRGCRVTAITISREQHALAARRVAEAGLAARVDVQLRDYRDLDGAFDKLVSIEMLEAVGYAHMPDYFERCARVLRPGGRFAVQTITMPDERFAAYRRRVDWMQTYIFPGSLIPSLAAIRNASRPAGFAIERADDIGPDYAPTLRAWRTRFLAELPRVRALGFDETFVRTWLLYFAFSEAAFVERTLGDHQLLLTR